MTDFQTGDVVRLTGARVTLRTLLIDLNDRHDEAFRAIEDALDDRDIHYSMCFSNYIPSPPQAVLDAILDNACPASEPDADSWCAYVIESHCAEHALTARKVDGHWQVKSVGSSS